MNSNTRVFAASALFCCFPFVSALAQTTTSIDPKARALLDTTVSMYLRTTSYSDTTSLSTTSNGMLTASGVKGLNFTASVAWQRPNLVRVVRTDIPLGKESAVSNGKIFCAITPQHAGYFVDTAAGPNAIEDAIKIIRLNYPGLEILTGADNVLSMQSKGLTSLSMGSTTSLNGIAMQSVVGTLSTTNGGTAVETFLIGVKDGCLHRLILDYSGKGGYLDFVETHSNIKLNPALPLSTFIFTPPPHARPESTF